MSKLHLPFLFLLIIAASLLPWQADAAAKTDIVVLRNGDHLTGEVKNLSRGVLHLSTDALGTVNIEWEEVAQVISTQDIQVETSTGTRFFGQLVKPEKEGMIVVSSNDGAQELDARRIVLMSPIEERGIQALDIDVSLGYNFAKAGSVEQATVGFDMDYRTLLRIYSLTGSTVFSDSSGQDTSRRSQLAFQYTRLRNNRWNGYGNVSLTQNDELGLNLRTSIGGGIGRYLIQNNSMLLALQGGLLFSRENNVGEEGTTDSVEASIVMAWDWFRFQDPELDWSTTLEVLPNLTDRGRIRAEFDTSLRWEIINDLKWGLTFYSSYDNEPQSETAETNDYGINTTFTYEF